MSDTLTPTQDLCMEVLAARHRLGHHEWPFSTRLTPAIRALEDRGLVSSRSGIVERTILVSLTRVGREAVLDPAYKPDPTGLLDALIESGALQQERYVMAHSSASVRYVTDWRAAP